MSEILSQSEIDALLKMMGDDGGGGDPWQPGEQEALSQMGVLVAEVATMTWQNRLGADSRVAPPLVEQVAPADAVASVTGPGLWVVGRLGGAMQGRLAFWLGGGLGAALAEKILGRNPGAEAISDDELNNLALGVSTLFGPLGETLGELAQGTVTLEQSGEQWAVGAEAGDLLKSLLDDSTQTVRLEFSCRLGEASGPLLCFWPLPDARAFLAKMAPVGEAAAPPAAAPSAPAPAPAAAAGEGARPSARPEGEVARQNVREADFQSLNVGTGQQAPHNIELILDVPLVLTVELGRAEKQIREILALGPGSVIELDHLAGEAVDVMVNGKLIAKGEVVVVDDNFGIRITDIISRMERISKLR